MHDSLAYVGAKKTGSKACPTNLYVHHFLVWPLAIAIVTFYFQTVFPLVDLWFAISFLCSDAVAVASLSGGSLIVLYSAHVEFLLCG